MIYNEELRAQERSEYLVHQHKEVLDPLKEQVRKQIGKDLDARRAAFAACGQMQDSRS